MKLEFLHIFRKNSEIFNFKKVCPVGAELFHEARQTDRQMERHMMKHIVALRNFAKAHKRNSHHRNYDD
jgi:hypothetical protein